MRRHCMVYGARRRRRRVLAVALPLTAVAALVAVIVSTVVGRDDSSRGDSRPALRVAARAVAGWVPPPLTPVSAAGQPGRVQQFVARGADQSAAAGRTVGGSDGAVVRVARRLGQRFGGDRGEPRAGKPAQPRAGGRRVGSVETRVVRPNGRVRRVCRPVTHVRSGSARLSPVRPAHQLQQPAVKDGHRSGPGHRRGDVRDHLRAVPGCGGLHGRDPRLAVRGRQPQAVRGDRARPGRRLLDHHGAGVVGCAGRRVRAGGRVRIGQGPDPLTTVGAGARRHGRRRVRSGRRADLRAGGVDAGRGRAVVRRSVRDAAAACCSTSPRSRPGPRTATSTGTSRSRSPR